MYTFSQMIDGLIAELNRPDQKVVMSNALNQTIRELHFSSEHYPIGFSENLVEEVLTADVDEGFVYPLTDPRLYQAMESVFYPQVGQYATMRRPNNIRTFVSEIGGQQYGWYRTGDSIAYSNYGGDGAEIWIAWFMYCPRLIYYPAGSRPCEWDEAIQDFTFSPAYDSTPELQAQALSLCTNWLIQRWWDTLASGVRAKTWARLGDEVRSKTAYSLFENQRPNLVNAETFDLAPRYRR